VPGLGASFGRGAATGFQRDLANSDCILVMGSNMAEAHPVGFRWALKAKESGGVLIHVDPRFTRTSAMADVFVRIRAGSDIAFLGGIINYILEHDRWFREYVLHYTNAATIIRDEYNADEPIDGLFAGFNASTGQYDRMESAWDYVCELSSDGSAPRGLPRTDPALEHPMCVMQILRRHIARYTPARVAETCGCSPDDVVRVAELMCRNSGRERTSSVVYALGWTQHSSGVQMIRAAAIIQLLLGNVGRPGGGIMAMRGHSSIQGSTDIATLYDLLPGYLPQPAAIPEHATLADYIRNGRSLPARRGSAADGFWREDALRGWWSNLPKFMTSLLKAWYGDAATPANDFGYGWLGKIDDDYSHLNCFMKMLQGEVRGMFLIGQNPAAGGPNARLHRAAMRKLDWLVVRDWFEHESASFWYADPEVDDPHSIATEVFLLPAAAMAEKDGTVTNTERMLQWHDKSADPPGDCRSDAWFMFHLGRRLKELYRDSKLERDAPIQNLTWDYDADAPAILPDGKPSRIADEPDLEKVLKEINGYRVADRIQLKGFADLADDGSTACGCWIYSGVFPDAANNRARSRNGKLSGWLYPEWGFAWPANRRIMYNRASADAEGRPWSERKKLIWWDERERRWTGFDVPDFELTKPPDYRPPPDARGMAAIAGDAPFIMHPDGRGWLFAPFGVKDGPLPVHYEPRESPFENRMHRMQSSPTLRVPDSALNPMAAPGDPAYPLIATTYRLTEHYLSGPMSRFNSWLNELQPEMFFEISPELARERGIEHGGWMVVTTPRGEIEARAMVTPRMKPVQVGGGIAHHVGIPIHWGYAGETVGAMANDLTSIVLDPNVSMHETKAFACEVRAGRLSGVRRPRAIAAATRANREEPIPDTPDYAQPEGRMTRDR
jgi:formate dehydrogenase major subunit